MKSIALTLASLLVFIPVFAHAAADNRTSPFPDNDLMRGYWDGVVKGSQDVNAFNADKINGVDGNNPPSCPLPDIKDYCKGYAHGYTDKVVDRFY
jgi:hypothetical protein